MNISTISTMIAEQDKYKLIISEKVETTIRTICSHIHKEEWSGILFYSVKGSLENKDLVLTAEDILLMHKGTAGFTEFTIDEDVAFHIAMNDLAELKMGLIHSHNNMAAYFSGTDQNTLKILGEKQIHFLSLIINNEGKYVARLTRKESTVIESEVHIKSKKYTTASTFDNINKDNVEDIEPEVKIEKTEDSQVFYYDLDIEINYAIEGLEERITEISSSSVNSSYGTYGSGIGFNTPTGGTGFNKGTFPKNTKSSKSYTDRKYGGSFYNHYGKKDEEVPEMDPELGLTTIPNNVVWGMLYSICKRERFSTQSEGVARVAMINADETYRAEIEEYLQRRKNVYDRMEISNNVILSDALLDALNHALDTLPPEIEETEILLLLMIESARSTGGSIANELADFLETITLN